MQLRQLINVSQLLKGIQLSRFSTTAAVSDAEATVRQLPRGFNKPPAFSVFIKQNSVPDKNVVVQMKELATKWRTLTAEEKQKYTLQAEKIGKERAAKFSQLDVVGREALIKENGIKKEKQQKQKIKQALKKYRLDTNRPVRLASPFILYHNDELKKVAVNRNNVIQLSTNLGATWKQLDEAAKKPYYDAYAAMLVKYKADVAAWVKTYGAEYKKLRNSFKHKTVAAPKKVKVSKVRGRKGGLYKRLTTRKASKASKKVASKE